MKKILILSLAIMAFTACKKEEKAPTPAPTPSTTTLNATETSLAGSWVVTYEALLDTAGNIIPGSVITRTDTTNCRLDLFTTLNATVGNNYKDGYQGLACIYAVTYWKATPTHLDLFGTLYYIRTLTSSILELTFTAGPNTAILHLER